MITQLSFLPDNDVEPRVKRASVPVAKLVGGRWCWKAFNSDEYVHEPDLERTLLAALGGLPWALVPILALGQWLAKTVGGAAWSWLLRPGLVR